MRFLIVLLLLLPCAQAWGNATHELIANDVCPQIGCQNCSEYFLDGNREYRRTTVSDPLLEGNDWLNKTYSCNQSVNFCECCNFAGITLYYYAEYYDPSLRLGFGYKETFEASVDKWVRQNRSRWMVSVAGVEAEPDTLTNLAGNFTLIFTQKLPIPEKTLENYQETNSSSYENLGIGIYNQNTSSSQSIYGNFGWFGENQSWFFQETFGFWNIVWVEIALFLIWLLIWKSQMKDPSFWVAYNRTPSWGKNFVTSWGAVFRLTFYCVAFCNLLLIVFFWILPMF